MDAAAEFFQLPDERANQGQIKVVALDDHHLVRKGICSLLAESSEIHLVDEGWAGEHLMPLVEEHQPDVVLLDLGMPQKNGHPGETGGVFRAFPAISRLQQHYPHVRVIVISQYASPALIEGALDAGVRGYLLKDDALSLNLIEAIRSVYMNGIYLSGEASRQLVNRSEPDDAVLTRRQLEILQAITACPDLSYAEQAARLGISEHTFSNHLRQIFKRLDVPNVTAAVVKAIQLHLVSVAPGDDHQLTTEVKPM